MIERMTSWFKVGVSKRRWLGGPLVVVASVALALILGLGGAAALSAVERSLSHPLSAAANVLGSGAAAISGTRQTQAAPPATGPADPVRRATTVGSVQAVSIQASSWLTIPRLGLKRIPIADRGLNSQGQMLIAPGLSVTRYMYSATPGSIGNVVIYGHDDIQGSVFRYLGNLRPGDQVTIDTQPGGHFAYQVTGQQVVRPDDVDILNPTSTPTLTLFTCYPYWVDDRRMVVTAVLQ
jgi:sortase A